MTAQYQPSAISRQQSAKKAESRKLKTESIKRGFTLIELMVTIAIIAILATIGMVVYSTTQKTARISKRVQDLDALKTSLELYKSSVGNYPAAAVAGTFACISTPLAGLVPSYMPALPADPLDSGNPAGTNCYEYTSNSATAASSNEYKLGTKTSIYGASGEMNSAAFGQQTSLLDPARDGTADCIVQSGATYQGWAIYSGGTTTCAYLIP